MKLLNVNELAEELQRHRSYVTDMKRAGFVMPGGRCTIEDAMEWFRRNPHFRTRRGRKREAIREL